jgi:uncharacterized membrane protein YeaQ/YmgE (transglycosylase-associated protein family)
MFVIVGMVISDLYFPLCGRRMVHTCAMIVITSIIGAIVVMMYIGNLSSVQTFPYF